MAQMVEESIITETFQTKVITNPDLQVAAGVA
jgi:hypothetical protein